MNKKLMAAAVAGVLVAPAAFAQSSNVQLYGRINGGLDYYKATGATNTVAGQDLNRGGRFRVFDNSSRVGLRGTEDLGNGLKAIFQIESGVNIDNGASQTGQGGQTNVSTGFWGTRDTYGGLQAGWGRLTYGRQSIYWVNGVNAPFAGAWINTEIPWTNGTNLGRVSNGGIITARVSNTIQYTSPTWAGNNFTLSWSPSPQEAVQAQSTVGAGGTLVSEDTNGQILGATWRGTFGPIYAQIDWAQPQLNTTTTTVVGGFPVSSKKKGTLWKAGLGWGYLPGARISAIWVRTTNNQPTGATVEQNVYKDGYTINWYHTFGNLQAMAQYGWTGDAKGCAAVDAATVCNSSKSTAFMVGGRYLLSKRTWLYLSYNYLKNQANEFVDYTGAAQTSVNGNLPYGADPQVLALGFFHHF
jgi:predicted porin